MSTQIPTQRGQSRKNHHALTLIVSSITIILLFLINQKTLSLINIPSNTNCIHSNSNQQDPYPHTHTSSSSSTIANDNNNNNDNDNNNNNADSHAEVLPTDIIYSRNSRSTFVIPEYKLIFFTFPKVACSEWKRMFMRINANQNWCKIRGFDAHDPGSNHIQILSDYPTEIATAMLTSPKWKRAMIVREPKERVLSAFLDKAVKEHHQGTTDKKTGGYYIRKCCSRISNETDSKLCMEQSKDFKSFLTFVTKYPRECFDVHWEPQLAKIDSKWWSYIDFVGYQHNLVNDAQTLLKTLTSTKDTVTNRTAWERYGQSGWGNDNELCEKRPYGFLEENSSAHKLETGSHLMEWYTPETEKMVEEHWAIEWMQEKVQFPKLQLFEPEDEEDKEDKEDEDENENEEDGDGDEDEDE